ncbi:MFS transporter [Actinokineospora inagensis]|uniref:MFS transporter n=1 Tax=Actinokineospora inagensis TaxID=103730 RepID=UPI0003F85B86|nr:MFS transporter [Actinokineospora inagensis]
MTEPAATGIGVLRSRTFRLFWAGETTSKFGSAMTVVVLPLVAVDTLHASTFLVGVLQAAAWIPWLAIGFLVGAWVDRASRWRVMLLSDIASALAFASVPVAWWLGVLTMWHLLATALVAGVASVFFSTAYSAYLPVLLPGADLGAANSRLQGTEKAAQVAGPGIGGVIAQLLGSVGVLLIDALTFVVSAVCLRFLRVPEPHVQADASGARPGLLTEIGAGVRFLWTDGYLRSLSLYAAGSNLAAGALQAVLVVFLVREVGLPPAAIGILLGGIGVGGILGALAAAPLARRFGTARTIILCELVAMPFALLIPLTGTGFGVVFLLVGGAVVSAGIVPPNVISATFVQTYCPDGMIGRVSAGMRVVNFGTLPLGALLGGALGDSLGTRTTMWIIAGTLVACIALLLCGPVGRVRDLPSRPQPLPRA